MPAELKDDELMELIKKGDKQAFRQIFHRHKTSIYSYCLCQCGGDAALAEDVVQEAWLKVIRAAENYEGKGQFKAWLKVITRNTAFTHLRGKTLLHFEPEKEEANFASESNIEQDILERSPSERVQKALDSLPAAQRKVLCLWIFEDLSYAEIVAATGQSEPTVRTLLFRAKKAVREKLEKVTA